MVDKSRITILKQGEAGPGPVIYWMSREQRVRDNWALLFAQECALEIHQPLAVAFCLAPAYLGATRRHYDFMLRGLAEVQNELTKLSIPLFLLPGTPPEEIRKLASRLKASRIVADFNPLRTNREWKEALLRITDIPVAEVDAHNIVPCRIASGKAEYGAYTLRPKLHRLLPAYLTEIPNPVQHPFDTLTGSDPLNREELMRHLKFDHRVAPVSDIVPGSQQAIRLLNHFINRRLPLYADHRNHPEHEAQSCLSPYLHFGQLAPQRVALEVIRLSPDTESRRAFLEELIVRRELSDNFCLYQEKYDSMEGFTPWARQTLNEHRGDHRQYRYSPQEFEQAATHEPLWNAAQQEMAGTGKMHGYLRMYWAKKILEWSTTPEEALETAIWLNDRYSLDGRDPNGYAGIAWAIGGVHDRPWFERPVFGKIRYMNDRGCRSKFDVDRYIRTFLR